MTNPQLKLAVEDFEVEYELVPVEVDERRIAVYDGINKIEEMLDANLQKIEELNSDIDRLTNHADGLDYTVAVASGIITGLIDSFFGEEIKKAKVIPSGSPALVKPIKIGILEQEQKGVTVPRSAALAAPFTPVKPVRIRLVRSGGK